MKPYQHTKLEQPKAKSLGLKIFEFFAFCAPQFIGAFYFHPPTHPVANARFLYSNFLGNGTRALVSGVHNVLGWRHKRKIF